MKQVGEGLWETGADAPFPGVNSHAYLCTLPSTRNALFYSVVGARDFDRMEELGPD